MAKMLDFRGEVLVSVTTLPLTQARAKPWSLVSPKRKKVQTNALDFLNVVPSIDVHYFSFQLATEVCRAFGLHLLSQ